MPSSTLATDQSTPLNEALARWIPTGSDVVLFDIPVNRNVGDLFILAVVDRMLAERGCRVVYRAGVRDYRDTEARRRVGRGTVIVGLGGGNFGDTYPAYQALRERVVADYPSNRVVILPQTIFFRDERALERCASHLARHPDLHIAVRDARSVEVARRCTPHVTLMPDVVDLAGPAVLRGIVGPRVGPPDAGLFSADGTLFLMRRDKERSSSVAVPAAGVSSVDWPRVFPDFRRRLMAAALLMPIVPVALSGRVHDAWASCARELLVRAVDTVRCADRVVTDRLHGAIIARLGGRPVTLIDNSYGKLTAYHDAWWRNDPTVTLFRAS